MRLLIAGSRDWTDYDLIREYIVLIGVARITCIMQGECRGADLLAKRVAIEYAIPHEDYPADWTYYGNFAGPQRNQKMIDNKPDRVLCFHDSIHEAKGTGDLIQRAEAARIPVAIVSHRNECGWILEF